MIKLYFTYVIREKEIPIVTGKVSKYLKLWKKKSNTKVLDHKIKSFYLNEKYIEIFVRLKILEDRFLKLLWKKCNNKAKYNTQ